MSDARSPNRRSVWNALRVEEDLTRRQLGHILVCAVVFILGTTAAMSAHYFWLEHAANGTVPETGSLVDEFAWHWAHADDFRHALLSWIVGMTGMSAVFTVGIGAYLARTVAGPVHGMKRDLAEIAASGRPGRVRLREGDQLTHLAESINRAIEAVGAGAVAADGQDASERLESLRQGVIAHLERLDTGGLEAGQRERLEAWMGGLEVLVEKSDGLGDSRSD